MKAVSMDEVSNRVPLTGKQPHEIEREQRQDNAENEKIARGKNAKNRLFNSKTQYVNNSALTTTFEKFSQQHAKKEKATAKTSDSEVSSTQNFSLDIEWTDQEKQWMAKNPTDVVMRLGYKKFINMPAEKRENLVTKLRQTVVADLAQKGAPASAIDLATQSITTSNLLGTAKYIENKMKLPYWRDGYKNFVQECMQYHFAVKMGRDSEYINLHNAVYAPSAPTPTTTAAPPKKAAGKDNKATISDGLSSHGPISLGDSLENVTQKKLLQTSEDSPQGSKSENTATFNESLKLPPTREDDSVLTSTFNNNGRGGSASSTNSPTASNADSSQNSSSNDNKSDQQSTSDVDSTSPQSYLQVVNGITYAWGVQITGFAQMFFGNNPMGAYLAAMLGEIACSSAEQQQTQYTLECFEAQASKIEATLQNLTQISQILSEATADNKGSSNTEIYVDSSLMPTFPATLLSYNSIDPNTGGPVANQLTSPSAFANTQSSNFHNYWVVAQTSSGINYQAGGPPAGAEGSGQYGMVDAQVLTNYSTELNEAMNMLNSFVTQATNNYQNESQQISSAITNFSSFLTNLMPLLNKIANNIP